MTISIPRRVGAVVVHGIGDHSSASIVRTTGHDATEGCGIRRWAPGSIRII